LDMWQQYESELSRRYLYMNNREVFCLLLAVIAVGINHSVPAVMLFITGA